MSAKKAAAPNTLHTATYPPRNAAIARPGRSCPRAAAAKSRISGRLEGSIIAASIACQATMKSSAAAQRGLPFPACPC